jgi:hypothetical protein
MPMCDVCSRRSLVAEAITTFLLGPAVFNPAKADHLVACGFKHIDISKLRNSMRSRSWDSNFDRALIAELKGNFN